MPDEHYLRDNLFFSIVQRFVPLHDEIWKMKSAVGTPSWYIYVYKLVGTSGQLQFHHNHSFNGWIVFTQLFVSVAVSSLRKNIWKLLTAEH